MSAALLDLDLDLDLDLFYMSKTLDMNRMHYNSLVDQKAVRSLDSAPGLVSLSPGVFHRKWTDDLEVLTRFSLDFCSTENNAPASHMNKENKFRDRAYSETGDRGVLQQKTGSQVNSAWYKTELCRPFEENGSCKYGDKCQFAHGYQELRSLTRHPKYKTEPCRTFHTIGFCPYGPRCHFIHNAEERRPVPLTNANLQEVQKVQQTPYTLRPKLCHSFSFSSHSGPVCPMSRTPTPPSFYNQLLSPGSEVLSPGSEVLSPGSEVLSPGSEVLSPGTSFSVPLSLSSSCTNPPPVFDGTCPPSPQTYTRHLETLRGLSRSPVSEPPSSPPDSLSDHDSYGSCSSSGSLSGSESPSLDPGKRLPIFSRLSISED